MPRKPSLRLAVAGLAIVAGLSGCGDDGTSATAGGSRKTTTTEGEGGTTTSPPDRGVVLTESGACGDAYFWATDASGDIAITVNVDAQDRSTSERTTIAFTVPDDEVEAQVLRGRDLARNFCTDVIDTESQPASTTDAVAGQGEIILQPAPEDGAYSCGSTNGTLEMSGFEAEDGTRFEPVIVASDDIGCYAG
jgi:hypothetical protein